MPSPDSNDSGDSSGAPDADADAKVQAQASDAEARAAGKIIYAVDRLHCKVHTFLEVHRGENCTEVAGHRYVPNARIFASKGEAVDFAVFRAQEELKDAYDQEQRAKRRIRELQKEMDDLCQHYKIAWMNRILRWPEESSTT